MGFCANGGSGALGGRLVREHLVQRILERDQVIHGKDYASPHDHLKIGRALIEKGACFGTKVGKCECGSVATELHVKKSITNRFWDIVRVRSLWLLWCGVRAFGHGGCVPFPD